MRALSLNETQEVNGGLWPLVIIGGLLLSGCSNDDQASDQQQESDCVVPQNSIENVDAMQDGNRCGPNGGG